jgi:hypothetical protein
MAEGFGTGLIEGAQAADQHSMSMLQQVEGGQKIEMNKQAIEQTKLTLEKQRQMMIRLAHVNQQSASDPQGQARALATESLNYGQAAMEAGLPEEGFKAIETGSKLLTNAALMDERTAKTQMEHATLAANLMDTVHDQASWQQALMVYQGQTGQPSPFSKMPYSPELVEKIKGATVTAKDRAGDALKEAQAAAARAEVPLRAAEAERARSAVKLNAARQDALGKAGGKATKADQRQADAQADVLTNIDHMLDQLGTMEDDPTGLKGRYHHFMEFAGSVTGMEKGTEVTKFHQDVDALQLKLSAAMTSRQYRSKDIQNLIKDIADLKAMGTSRATATAKLEELRTLVKAELDKGPVRPSGESKVMTLDEYIAAQGGDAE